MYDFKDLKIYQLITDENLKNQVNKVIDIASNILNEINGEYKEYTFHDVGHAYRVAQYMSQIALGLNKKDINERIEKFSQLEYALMLMSAVLHDVGMFYTDEEYYDIVNKKELYLNQFTYQGVLRALLKNDPNTTERQAVHETIRKLHHVRSSDFIKKNLDEVMIIDGIYHYSIVVADICRAHGENYANLNSLSFDDACGKYHFDARYIAAILRIADLLDIDGQRTPILWYKLNKPQGISDREWKTNFSIENYDKLSEVDGKLMIEFYGKSKAPEIHRNYLSYIDNLRRELINASDLLAVNCRHEFLLLTKIADKVKTVEFEYVDLRLNLDYNSITELLMGTNIYRNKRLGLRELIQNAIDACKLRNEKEALYPVKFYQPRIIIEISKKHNFVKILDNGIGMDLNILKNYFLNVGISYYNSDEFYYRDFEYKPIGKFGIGFLACYLLSNKVKVKSKYYFNEQSIQIELEKGSEYVVTKRNQKNNEIGTEIELCYQDFFGVFEGIDDLAKFLGANFFTDIPISLINIDDANKEIKFEKRHEFFRNFASDYKNGMIIENIVCDKHDNDLRGNIIIRLKDYSTQEEQFNDLKYVYLYCNGKFEKHKPNEIRDGVYLRFKYPVLDKSDLKNKSKLKTIINDKLFSFFILDNIPYNLSGIVKADEIGDNRLEDILKKSGIIPIDYDMLEVNNIFKNGLDCLLLQNSKIRYTNNNEFDEKTTFFNQYSLYYREIFVRNVLCEITTPFDFQILGWCIDNIDLRNKLKLNVSRQGFVDERPYYAKIAFVIYSHFYENKDNKSKILDNFLKMQIDKFRASF